jgi:hypothetical protein
LHYIPDALASLEIGPGQIEQTGAIQLANKYTFVSELTDLNNCLR